MTRGLAVVGPLAIWAAAIAAILAFRDAEQATADDNAGRVLNARVVQSDVVETIEQRLEARSPRVVVIGPSYANTNLRPAELARRLGLEPSELVLVSVPNSVGAHWYAILKYRVLGAGHRPDLVLFVSGLQSMLLNTPLSESSFVNLRVHLPEQGDPRIDAKARGSFDLWWATLREQRGRVRDAFFDGIRDGAVFWAEPEPTRRALGRVFDASGIDMALYRHAMPVVESARAERGFTPDLLPTPEDSFLADTTALATEAGAMAVWVRPPMSPHIPPELDDVAPPGFQSRAVEVVREHGGAYVDLRHLRMSSRMFRNADHMNTEGSKRFTQALARVVLERGWLPTEPPPPWPLEVAGPSVLASGETLTVKSAAAWPDERGDFAIRLSAESLGERQIPPFTLRWGDEALTVQRGRALVIDGQTWQQWRLAQRLPAPHEPRTLTLAARWPGVRVQGLAFGATSRVFAIGDEASLHGERAVVLGDVGASQRAIPPGVTLETPRSPGPVPNARRAPIDLPGPVAAFDTHHIGFLSDEALQGSVSWSEPCSPLRIAEDGALLPRPNAPCTEVRSLGRGRSCHTQEELFFTASDESDPARNGRDYELQLAADRECGGEVFLYPEDQLRFTVAPERVAHLVRGARFLGLRGRYLQRRRTEVRVRLLVGGQPVLDRTVEGRRFGEGNVWLPLETTAWPDAAPWVVEIDNLDATFYLLRRIELAERRPPRQ